MRSEFIEIEEKTIDEAIEKACQEFGVPREKLNIEIISGESGGFWGLFSKKAKIKASLLALDIDFSFADNPREKSEATTRSDHARDKGEKKPESGKKNEKEIITEQSSPKIEPKIKSEPKVKAELKVKNEPEAVVYIPASPMAMKARDLFEGILKRISSEYSVNVNETQEKIILGIEGDESGLLIGKRGQNLDAFQYIMNKAINKIDGEHKMVMIDSGEYRKRREEFLLGLAEKIKKKVKKTKKPVSLANMNAHDRRIIHLVMQEDESLVTQSRGEGKFRKIVILPAKTGHSRRARDKMKD